MGKNIIICSDGTGNTFDSHVTNVTHLIKCLALDNHRQQVVVYDQGIGTAADRWNTVDIYRNGLDDIDALRAPKPVASKFWPLSQFDLARGLLFGYGLRENVRELYGELARLYEGPDDRVFLFGFSRGAFAVRALAGLLYRCQLPPDDCSNVDARFEKAWELFEVMHENEPATSRFRAEQQPCPVHFLGIWDTVKSYGGLNPVMLPHLRHNPIVRHVRHALALHEHRAWFKPTTWGQLDLDADGAAKRLNKNDAHLFESQDIAEVWFAGCHSDIGGGDDERETAKIALRWMLGEAVNVSPAMQLNDAGKALLGEVDPPGPPQIHESFNSCWRLVEKFPRREIDNSGAYPVKKKARGSDGTRDPGGLRRQQKVFLHATVGNLHSISGEIVVCQTRPFSSGSGISIDTCSCRDGR